MMRRGLDKIPDKAGIYIWRYWPSLVDIEVSKFMETLKRWKETQPQFEESVKNSRITVSVKRTPFGVSGDKINMFGLGMSHGKAKSLEEAIGNDSDIRQLLAYTLETLLSSTPPLYIGKADNLRSRLNDHFEGRSSSLISNKQAYL